MIKGLDLFREYFADYADAFCMIGGAACDEWLVSQGLQFRATKDLDIVLVIEVINESFVKRFRDFIEAGGYQIRERTGDEVLYRFAKPKHDNYPFMLELFTRQPKGIDLAEGQTIVPIKISEAASLSAILLDDDYYHLILEHRGDGDDRFRAMPVALVPLKARAWLDLTQRQKNGEKVDDKNIAKHRSDVFRLAGTLPDEEGPELASKIKEDLRGFLAAFPESSEEWQSILAALKNTFGSRVPAPAILIGTLRKYFRLEQP